MYSNFLLAETLLLYLPIQMHFAISNSLGQTKLTNSFEKQPLKLFTCMWSGCAPWIKLQKICAPAGIKQTIFMQFFFFIFELGGITKHLITGPAGNSEFCFSSLNIESFRETKLTVSFITLPATWHYTYGGNISLNYFDQSFEQRQIDNSQA